jgi:hypothetical protein
MSFRARSQLYQNPSATSWHAYVLCWLCHTAAAVLIGCQCALHSTAVAYSHHQVGGAQRVLWHMDGHAAPVQVVIAQTGMCGYPLLPCKRWQHIGRHVVAFDRLELQRDC